jgi:hypothetical protein
MIDGKIRLRRGGGLLALHLVMTGLVLFACPLAGQEKKVAI